MGEINFLDTAKSKERVKSSANNKKGFSKKTIWTKAKKDNATGGSKSSFTAKPSSPKHKNDDDKDDKREKRIKKSREEVLEIIKKDNKKAKKHAAVSDQKPASWLKIFFKAKDKKKIIDKKGDIKKEKTQKNAQAASEQESEKGETKENKQKSPMNFASDSWESSDVLETNLISGSDIAFFDKGKKYKLLVFSSLFSILLLVGIYVGLNLWEQAAIEEINQQKETINALSAKISKLEKNLDEINLFQKKLHAVRTLLDRHVYWTNFFTFLEDNTLADIQYNNGFEGDNSGNYTFSIDSDDFDKIAKQVKIFRANKLVDRVEITDGQIVIDETRTEGISPEEEPEVSKKKSYSFEIETEINPKVFTYHGLEEDSERSIDKNTQKDSTTE